MPDGRAVDQGIADRGRAQPDGSRITDESFMRQLAFLRALKDFSLEEAVKIPPDDPVLLFDGLNVLRSAASGGRAATPEEWNAVEEKTRKLLSYLDDAQRKRFRLSRATPLPIAIAVGSIVFALIALIAGVVLSETSPPPQFTIVATPEHLLAFLLWLVSLGAMGAAAFLFVNALSIQIDPHVDVINPGFVAMRAILGALFGTVLSLPFGYHGFLEFCMQLRLGAAPGEWKQGALLLLPFVLGFSTPLVLAMLNRMIDSIQLFFGLKPAPASAGNDTEAK